MEKLIRDTLILLNVTPKEIKFFESSFFLGPATINEITKHAKLERSTSYLIASSLIEKGLLEEDYKQYRKKLVAITPEKLLSMLSAKKRRIGRQEIELQEKMSELSALHSAENNIPKVKVYKGPSGLLTIWQDILKVPQEVLLWTNQETEHTFFTPENHEKFIKDRVNKNIPLKVLAVNNPKGRLLLDGDDICLRETKLLPLPIMFSAETYIYGSKIAVIDYNQDIFGLLVDNEQISSAQRAIFRLQWQQREGKQK